MADAPWGFTHHNIYGMALAVYYTEAPPPPLRIRCADVKPSGVMSTLEVTRDLDADWDDSSTFLITQDEPLPFTLRGLVMRMSYNPD